MPLEFALRPRFDLKRPARRRRFSWLRLHPLIAPIGAYWLAAAGLTYAFVRSASVNVAGAAEPGSDSGDTSTSTSVAWGAPSVHEPATADTALPDVVEPQQQPEPMPEPTPVVAPPEDEPLPEPVPESAPRAVARAPEPPMQRPPARAAADDLDALTRTFEPEPREEALPQREPERNLEPAPSPKPESQTGSLPSCEGAAATANQTIDVGSSRRAPDLTRGAFAGVLEHGAYLTPCSIPPRTALEICAAVQNGTVVGVTVTTEPRDAAISACVRRAVANLRFPRSPELDVTRTRFERER